MKFFEDKNYYGCADGLQPTDPRLEKYELQFEERGFDDTVTWNLFHSMSQWLLPRLRRFKEVGNGYPSNLSNPEEWEEILDKMILAFQLIEEDDIRKRNSDVVDEGLDLFREYFFDLWL